MAKEGKEFNVLVVDDDKDVGILFERLLGGPHQVSIAADGYEAVEKIKDKVDEIKKG